MADVLDQLKEKKILSQNDIDNFQSYINKKYGALEEDKRYTILKNSVLFVVNRDLEKLEINEKGNFVLSLVEETLLKDKEDLCAYKIFHKILSEGQPSENLLQSLTDWVSAKIERPLEKEVLEEYIPNNNPYLEVAASEETFSSSASYSSKKIEPWLLWGLLLVFSLFMIFFIPRSYAPQEPPIIEANRVSSQVVLPAYVLKKYQKPNRNFPNYLYYRDIDEKRLKAYLISRNSLLQNEPHFSHLLTTAKDFNINPLLLFAVAGHEQGFVPIDHPNGDRIINNPFNVFGSWQKFNTNLKESSEVATRTIFNSLSDLPPFMDPFFWMNRRYAEDPHWWKGVKAIFWLLERDC